MLLGMRSGLRGTPPANAAPVNTVAPVITGNPNVGSTLTASQGSWTGYPTPSFAYQWKKGGVAISGATATTYVPVSGDLGGVITVTVTATNTQGSASATSTGTAAIAAALTVPANTVAPAITGTTAIGDVLTCSQGTWTGNPTPTYAYQWTRAGVDISGETASTHTLVSADAGTTVACRVTATNSQGNASATATGSAIPALVAPANTVAPTISGSANTGQTLTASTGTWTGNPAPTYGYQWKRAGAAISGATASTYLLVSADEGSTITVTVTASNSQGSVSATSSATATVTPVASAPTNATAPTIDNTTPGTGSVLTANPGSWNGYPAPTYAYQWKRAGSNISGATSSTYTTVTADQGSAIAVTVTATNGSGSASATSSATAAVTGAPVNTVAPTLSSSSANVGTAISVSSNGTWTGYPSPSYTYQWYRFDTVTPISGATSSSYTPVSGDVGHTLSCNVIATNGSGSVTASTSATSAVTDTPSFGYDFTSATIPSGVTDTGGANGTRTNSSGLIVSASAPRFDYTIGGSFLGLLDEPSATNLLLNSASGPTGSGGAGTFTANNATAPDGTTTAGTLTAGTSNTRYFSSTMPSDGTFTASVWMRAPGGSASVHLSLSLGQATPTATTACAVTSTWQRFSVSGAFTNGATYYFQIGEWGTNGWGPSSAVQIWGGQLETGSVATTYIPTTGSAVTRTADAISFTVPSGVTTLVYTFDDNSTQNVSVTPGAYTVPTSLNRTRIKTITQPTPSAPVNTVSPTLSSASANVGTAISVSSNGTWSGYPAPTYAYQWFWFDTVTPISGATSSTYTPVSGDAGHTLACNVIATNTSGSATAATSATSATTTNPVVPTGALGLWYADTFDSTSKAVPNQVTAQGLSQSVLRFPRRIWDTGISNTALNVTASGGVGPDGLTEASLLAATGSGWYAFKSQVLSAGTYTLGVDIKSNSGSDQAFQMGLAAGLTSKTALAASYSRVSTTFTVGAGTASIYLIKDPTNATASASFLVCNLGLYPGSVDLGATTGYEDPVGHLYLGTSSTDTQPTYASGVIDFSSSGRGSVQFPTASANLSQFTALAVINKVSAGGTYEAFLSKIQAYDSFSAMIEQGPGIPYDYFNSAQIGTGGKTVDLQGQGWHLLCSRYDGTYLEWWLDGMLFLRGAVGSQSAVNVADLWAFCMLGSQNTGSKMNSMALYNRALTKTEIDNALFALTARAALNSISVTPPSKVWYVEGDSISSNSGAWPFLAYPNLTSGTQIAEWAVGGAIMSTPTSPIDNSLWGRAADLSARGLPTNKSGKKLILSVLIGANDLGGYPSGSAYATDLTAYLNNQRAAGFTHIVGCTVMNRANSTNFTNVRNQLNPLIRNMVGSGVLDAVIDFAADSIMGIDGVGSGGSGTSFGNTASGATGPYNTDYFSDGLHPTAAGYARMANIAYPVINAL